MTWIQYCKLSPAQQAKREVIAKLDAKSQEVAMRFHHPTAAQKAQAARNRKALDAWQPTEKELRESCQFSGLPKLRK